MTGTTAGGDGVKRRLGVYGPCWLGWAFVPWPEVDRWVASVVRQIIKVTVVPPTGTPAVGDRRDARRERRPTALR